MIYDGRNQVWTCSVAQGSAVWKQFWFVSVETCDISKHVGSTLKQNTGSFGTKFKGQIDNGKARLLGWFILQMPIFTI